MEIEIRKELPQDYQEVHAVHKEAFGQEDEAFLVERIRESANHQTELSLVAIEDSRIVGHILFSIISIEGTDCPDRISLALAPMAVIPEYQKEGVGKALVREGLKRAKELGFESVIVVGHPEYYPRFGFLPAEDFDISPPFEVPSEAFMAMELKEGALSGGNGVVRYPKEFDDLS